MGGEKQWWNRRLYLALVHIVEDFSFESAWDDRAMELANGSTKGRFGWYDRVLLILLAGYGMFSAFALLWVPRFFMPAEDAVILWAYSRNLVLHGAITYFAGGPRTEGATDFAWMLLVAGAMRCGLDPFLFTAVVNFLCLFLLAALLMRLGRVRVSAFPLLVVVGAACLFPQVFAAASGFATLPDAVLLTLLVVCVYERRAAAGATVALIFCLFRPDGTVFAVPLLFAMVVREGRNRRDVVKILILFVGLGAAYFLWRAWYFGELFPLPFLVKADTHRLFHTVNTRSVRTSLSFLLFSILALLPMGRRQILRSSNVVLVICLVVIPTLFYWCMRLDQNVGFRFFFYLPLAAAILLALNWSAVADRHAVLLRVGFAAWLVLLAMPLRRELRTSLDLQSPELRAIAIELGQLPAKGIMLSTEAGILPYYSEWASIDPWGLNTAEFGHRFFQPEDVARIAPDVIHLHADQEESCLAASDMYPAMHSLEGGRDWTGLIRNIVAGTDPAKYDLWLTSYGSEHYRLRKQWGYGEGDRDCWFIRREFSEHDAIAKLLSGHNGIGGTEAYELEAQHVDRSNR